MSFNLFLLNRYDNRKVFCAPGSRNKHFEHIFFVQYTIHTLIQFYNTDEKLLKHICFE